MKLLVQDYLETHTFGDLAKEHGVYCSFSKSGHKWSLNYDMIESLESDVLAQECRGLILCKEDDSVIDGIADAKGKINRDHICPGKTKAICFPLKRFFNAGQGAAAEINWTDPNLKVLSKLDGTLILNYFDHIINEWCVATRAVSEADIIMNNGLFNFRQLFEKALTETTNLSFDQFTSKLDKRKTYCFELTSPYNRVVCSYPDNRVTLLAVRDLDTFKELDPNESNIVKDGLVPTVVTFNYNSLPELIEWVSTLNPLEHEGVVVRDSQFNRLKVKSASYLAFNRLHDSLATSPRNCLELILLEKDDDAISFLPNEIANNLTSIKNKYRVWLEKEQLCYENVLNSANAIFPKDKKTFALELNKIEKPFKAAYFNIFDEKCDSVKDFIHKAKKDGTWSNSFLDMILSYLN